MSVRCLVIRYGRRYIHIWGLRCPVSEFLMKRSFFINMTALGGYMSITCLILTTRARYVALSSSFRTSAVASVRKRNVS